MLTHIEQLLLEEIIVVDEGIVHETHLDQDVHRMYTEEAQEQIEQLVVQEMTELEEATIQQEVTGQQDQ
ncbi:hypothetical protein THALO_110055 [Tenacibaculum halocynthiae]